MHLLQNYNSFCSLDKWRRSDRLWRKQQKYNNIINKDFFSWSHFVSNKIFLLFQVFKGSQKFALALKSLTRGEPFQKEMQYLFNFMEMKRRAEARSH